MAKIVYVICGIDHAYLYRVTETRQGRWMPDQRDGAYLEREKGKGKHHHGGIWSGSGQGPEVCEPETGMGVHRKISRAAVLLSVQAQGMIPRAAGIMRALDSPADSLSDVKKRKEVNRAPGG